MLESNAEVEAVHGYEFTVEKRWLCGLMVYVRTLYVTTPDKPPRPGRWRKATKTELPELMQRLNK